MQNFSEKNFDFLCKECDEILLEQKTNIFRQGNHILHVVREHPIFTSRYIPIFKYKTHKFYFFLLKRFFLHLAKLFAQFFFIAISIPVRKKTKVFNKKKSSIFFSHFLKDSFINHNKDFYFSSLPDKFCGAKSNSIVFYINSTNHSSEKLNKKFNDDSKNCFALPKLLSLQKETKILLGLLKDGFRLFKDSFHYNGERKKVRELAAIESLSTNSRFSIRMFYLAKKIIDKIEPKYLFTTYEGHPWERLVYAAAKLKNKKIKNIGYQHALIFRKQHAIRRNLADQFNPDFILTSGKYGKVKLGKSKILSNEKIINFGSPRTDTNVKLLKSFNPNKNCVLFLPEGDYGECELMIDLAFELSTYRKNMNYIIRFHPLISVERLEDKFKKLLLLNENVKFSISSLENDLFESNYVIYRGTTAVVKAIEHGLYPIYFSLKNEMSINPLHDINIDSIFNKFDFSKIISTSELIKRSKLKKIQKHTIGFFSPLNYKEALKIKTIQ